MLRLVSEVPILEDTLMRVLIMGLSKNLHVSPSDAVELADQLVKRAAMLHHDGKNCQSLTHLEKFSVSLHVARPRNFHSLDRLTCILYSFRITLLDQYLNLFNQYFSK